MITCRYSDLTEYSVHNECMQYIIKILLVPIMTLESILSPLQAQIAYLWPTRGISHLKMTATPRSSCPSSVSFSQKAFFIFCWHGGNWRINCSLYRHRSGVGLKIWVPKVNFMGGWDCTHSSLIKHVSAPFSWKWVIAQSDLPIQLQHGLYDCSLMKMTA